MTEEARKFDPLTSRVNPLLPAAMVEGLRVPMLGIGFGMIAGSTDTEKVGCDAGSEVGWNTLMACHPVWLKVRVTVAPPAVPEETKLLSFRHAALLPGSCNRHARFGALDRVMS